jgi:hypothetical protein
VSLDDGMLARLSVSGKTADPLLLARMIASHAMGHEVHVTRGARFGDAGAEPITAEQWRAVVASQAAITAKGEPSSFARLHGRPIVFNAGLIAVTSPDAESFATLQAIAHELRARIFGEDGVEYTGSVQGEVHRTITAAFADLDVSGLGESTARELALVSDNDPAVAPSTRHKALAHCCQLTGAEARLGLAYLLCRAVESGGDPAPTLTCAAAHLLRHDPTRLDSFRDEPTQAFSEEVAALAGLLEKKPGLYVIRKCHPCGAKNRLPLFAPADRRPKCGRCKTLLAPVE